MTFGHLYAFVRRDFALAQSYRLQFVLETLGALFQLALFFIPRPRDRPRRSGP